MLLQLSVLSDLKICGLRWMDFVNLWPLFGVRLGCPVPQVMFWQRRLKVWNKEVFGHLDTKLVDLVDKIKVIDEKEQ